MPKRDTGRVHNRRRTAATVALVLVHVAPAARC